jgi:hypothetical protein
LKLADWANVAEVLSGIAVVVTLIVLVVGVRENTASVRASTYVDMLKTANEFDKQLITDPEIRDIFFAARLGRSEQLTGSERTIFGLIMQSIFREHYVAYTMRKYGQLEEEQWPEIEEGICEDFEIARGAGVPWSLDRLNSEFVQYVSSACSEGP